MVINAEKVVLSGRKEQQKKYYWHTQYPGGLKMRTFEQMREAKPEKIIEKAVFGMLPKNKLGRKLHGKLKVYAGSSHPHAAQKPAALSIVTRKGKVSS